jgi:hypothetical protein
MHIIATEWEGEQQPVYCFLISLPFTLLLATAHAVVLGYL